MLSTLGLFLWSILFYTLFADITSFNEKLLYARYGLDNGRGVYIYIDIPVYYQRNFIWLGRRSSPKFLRYIPFWGDGETVLESPMFLAPSWFNFISSSSRRHIIM